MLRPNWTTFLSRYPADIEEVTDEEWLKEALVAYLKIGWASRAWEDQGFSTPDLSEYFR